MSIICFLFHQRWWKQESTLLWNPDWRCSYCDRVWVSPKRHKRIKEMNLIRESIIPDDLLPPPPPPPHRTLSLD